MPAPNLPAVTYDVIGLTVVGRYGQELTINRLTYRLNPPDTMTYTLAELEELNTLWRAACVTPWRAICGPAWQFEAVITETLRDPAVAVWEVGMGGGDSGSHTGETLPPHVSLGLRKVTNHRGRKGRGMIRIAGIPEEGQVSGVTTTAYQVKVEDLANALDGPYPSTLNPGSNWVPCLAKQLNFVEVSQTYHLASADITSFSQNVNLGSQNSRKLGKGA